MNRNVFLALALVACGGSDPKAAKSAIGKVNPTDWPANDRSMCNFKGRTDIEVMEVTGAQSLRPNIRRVFQVVGDSEHAHRILLCREIDTNLDGIKDLVRTYNVKGESVREEADTNYDGKIDSWVLFAEGRIAEVQEDSNFDGRVDVWKYYTDGALFRVKRDRNHDGQADVWEMYSRNNKLERMGVDDTFDGHVDRWDRDDQLVREAEETEKKTREAMAAASDAGVDGK